MYDWSSARNARRPFGTSNRTTNRVPVNVSSGRDNFTGWLQPVPRGPPSSNGDESPLLQNNDVVKQKKPTSSNLGYGEYDYSHQSSPRATKHVPVEPSYVICYICGRKYGTRSIQIHEPQCLDKWHIENARLPPHMRRPPPSKPDAQLGTDNNHSLDQINNVAYAASKAQLIPCDQCGRRFAPDRIEVHLRSCKPGHTSKPIGGTMAPSASINERATQPRGNTFNGDYEDKPATVTYSNRRSAGGSTYRSASSSNNAGLYPCSVCNRNFSSDRIQQHEAACAKASKQRRVFDSTKQRLQGTEAAAFYRKTKARNEPAKSQVPKSNWRQKHQDFIQSIRYAKTITNYEKSGGRLIDLPPPPVSVNPDYVRCPHCGRNFAPGVAERHIPKCANIQHKPRPPPSLNRMENLQRVPISNTRTPMSNHNNNYGDFNNGTFYAASNRSTRRNHY